MSSCRSSRGGHRALSRARPFSWRRGLAAGCAAAIGVVSAAGPSALAAATAGSSNVLGQAQGSAVAPSPSPGAGASPGASASPGAGGSGASPTASEVLNPSPDWGAPGVAKGSWLIGWAKAGAMVLGTLGLVGGSVIGKVLRHAGNHHAAGVRETVMGIGGALLVAGVAGTLVPWLVS